MTVAMIGHGSTFQVGDGASTEVFSAFAEVFAITPPAVKRDSIDATHMTSTGGYREFIPGLIDAGEVSLQLNFDPSGTAQIALFGRLAVNVASNYRIVWPDASVWTFAAFLTAMSFEDPLDGKLVASATFKLTGKPAFIT